MTVPIPDYTKPPYVSLPGIPLMPKGIAYDPALPLPIEFTHLHDSLALYPDRLFRFTYIFKEWIVKIKHHTPIPPSLLLSLSDDLRRPEEMQDLPPTYFGYYWKPGDSQQYSTMVTLPRPKLLYRCACFKYVYWDHEFSHCKHVFQKDDDAYEIAYWLNKGSKQSVTEYWSIKCWETLKPYLARYYQEYLHKQGELHNSKGLINRSHADYRKKLYQDFNNSKTLYNSHTTKYLAAGSEDTKNYYAELANKALGKIEEVKVLYYSCGGAPHGVVTFEGEKLPVTAPSTFPPKRNLQPKVEITDSYPVRSPITVPPDTYYTCHPYESWLDDGYEGEEVQVQAQVPTHHIMPVLEG